jgi:hypothetical protein
VKKIVYQMVAVIILVTMVIGFSASPMAAFSNQNSAASQNSANAGCSTGDYPQAVSTSTTTLLSNSTITLGQSVTDTVTVTAKSGNNKPVGKVTFQVSKDGGYTFTTYSSKTLDANGQAISDPYQPTKAITYYFRAIYAGNYSFKTSQSYNKDEPLVVTSQPGTQKLTTYTTTDLSSDSITVGQSVTDTATVKVKYGTTIPTDNVTFQVSTDGGYSFKSFGTAKTLDSQGKATSDAYTTTYPGTLYFRAVYLGNANFKWSQSGNREEPLCVKAPPKSCSITTTTLSDTTITYGQSVTDSAIVDGLYGATATPTGKVTFQVSTDGYNFRDYSKDRPLDGNGQATSISYKPGAPGLYYFRAVYGGDAAYKGSQSQNKDEPLIVKCKPGTQKQTPVVKTDLSFKTITLGDSVTDSVTVTSKYSTSLVPGGQITFEVSQGNTSSFKPYGEIQTLDGQAKAVSSDYTPAAAGTYYFRASYSGDANFKEGQSCSGDEPLVVKKFGPTTTTTLLAADGTPLASDAVLHINDSVKDLATVTGVGSSIPRGTIAFQVKTPTLDFATYSTVSLVISNNGQITSGLYPLTVAGTYYFRALYNGDDNYTASSSDDDDEILYVEGPITTTEVDTTTTTQLISSTGANLAPNASVNVYDVVRDTATVIEVGTNAPISVGTVDFEVSVNGGDWVAYSFDNGLANGQATSDPYKVLTTGSYRFRALYSGFEVNDNTQYNPSQSLDNDETLNVTKIDSTISTQLSTTRLALEKSVTDTATLSVTGNAPAPTGTITFQWSYKGSAFATFDTVTLEGNNNVSSTGYTPLELGNYQFQAVYSGDLNYVGSTSASGSEPLEVFCDFRLPDSGVFTEQKVASYASDTTSCYFTMTLPDIGFDYSIKQDVIYDAWCANTELDWVNPSHVKIYSSLNIPSTASGHVQQIPWGKINYILNTYSANVGDEDKISDIQLAIWYFTNGFEDYDGMPQTDIDYIMLIRNTANANANFLPKAHDRIAVIMEPTEGDSQLNFIVVKYGC